MSISKIKLAICQPLIPSYRKPFFEELGTRYNYDLTIYSGDSKGSLFTIKKSSNYSYKTAPVRHLKIGNKVIKFQLKQIGTVLFKKYDIVVLPWDSGFLSMWVTLFFAKIFNVPIILWGHGYSKEPGSFRDYVRNLAANTADAIILYSDTVKKNILKIDNLKNHNIYIAPNALDYKEVAIAKEFWLDGNKLVDFKLENDLNQSNNIIFVSRLESNNKIDMLLDSLKLMKKNNIKLIIIGDGSQKQTLIEYKNKLGLDNVIFTGAIYEQKDLCPWMLSSKLCCYPTNIGLSLIHAFQYGLPVITSDLINNHGPEIESLIDGYNGYFYEDGSIESMSEKCLEIINNNKKAKELSNNALMTSKKYSLDNMLNGFNKAIESCVD